MKSIFEKNRAPLICTPITGGSEGEIINQLNMLKEHDPDVIEWRADFFTELNDKERVLAVLSTIKKQTDIPVLFTIRAMHEGGEEIPLYDREKTGLICDVCKYSSVDFIDYETSNGIQHLTEIKKAAEKYEKQLILSYHNFQYTPSIEVLKEKAQLAVEYGADIVKIAVMPENKEDVYHLLEATRKIDEQLTVPIITMSMGEKGALSRVIGWAYGSVLTFGVGVEASAPGQVPVKALRNTIQSMKELLPEWK